KECNGPQAGAGQSPYKKTSSCEKSLDQCHTEDSHSNAADCGPGELFKLRPIFAKNAIGKRACRTGANFGIRKKDSGNNDGKNKLHDGEANSRRSRKQLGDDSLDL